MRNCVRSSERESLSLRVTLTLIEPNNCRETLKRMNEGKPTLLINDGHMHHKPFPLFFSLSDRASQSNLAGSLAQMYGPQSVHGATVVTNGNCGRGAKGDERKEHRGRIGYAV